MVKKVANNNNEDTPGDALKERGHRVIDESRWEEFDKMVDNNTKSWFAIRYVTNVIDICEIMHDESMPIEQRRRKAYDLFQEQAHSGCTAHMTMDAAAPMHRWRDTGRRNRRLQVRSQRQPVGASCL